MSDYNFNAELEGQMSIWISIPLPSRAAHTGRLLFAKRSRDVGGISKAKLVVLVVIRMALLALVSSYSEVCGHKRAMRGIHPIYLRKHYVEHLLEHDRSSG